MIYMCNWDMGAQTDNPAGLDGVVSCRQVRDQCRCGEECAG